MYAGHGPDLEVKVLCEGWQPQSRAKGKGVAARRSLKEARGKTHERRNTNLVPRSSRSGEVARQTETQCCQGPWR